MIKTLHSSGTSVRAALKGLGRAERRRLTQEIIRSNHPTASNQMIKAMQAAGHYPRRYAATEISNATVLQLKEAVGATLSFAGSAATGAVRSVAIGIFEQTEN